jgi:hypothetical protein
MNNYLLYQIGNMNQTSVWFDMQGEYNSQYDCQKCTDANDWFGKTKLYYYARHNNRWQKNTYAVFERKTMSSEKFIPSIIIQI